MKLLEEITQTKQNSKQSGENNEFNYGTTISRNYLEYHKFPHQTMKVY